MKKLFYALFYIKIRLLGSLAKYINFIKINNSTSIISIEPNKKYITKKVILYNKYDVIDNEVKWLKRLDKSIHTPDFISTSKNTIKMSYCGSNLTKNNIPSNWKIQVDSILMMLKENNCSHNDIKPSDLLVLDGIIILIDFQWANETDAKMPNNWPIFIGRDYKASKYNFDDSISINKSINKIINS